MNFYIQVKLQKERNERKRERPLFNCKHKIKLCAGKPTSLING